MNNHFFLISSTFFSFFVYCQNVYQYPVACLKKQGKEPQLIVLKQESQALTAWLCDVNHTHMVSALSSFYAPAHTILLPNQAGFSFIDHDHIRIKYFEKRNPRTIEFCRPLYDVSALSWINDYQFYFSAREHKHFGLYHANIDGCCVCLHWSFGIDCLYPNKINDFLFFIERTKEGNFFLARLKYPDFDCLKERCCCVTRLYNEFSDSVFVDRLIDFSNQQVAFLLMISPYEGFILGYNLVDISKTELITFSFIHIRADKETNRWEWKSLFHFDLPWNLLFDPNKRLYESIIPLLPYYDNRGIVYFVTIADDRNWQNMKLILKSFNMVTGCVATEPHYFPYDALYSLGLLRVGLIDDF